MDFSPWMNGIDSLAILYPKNALSRNCLFSNLVSSHFVRDFAIAKL